MSIHDEAEAIGAQCALDFTNFREIYELLLGAACARTGASNLHELSAWMEEGRQKHHQDILTHTPADPKQVALRHAVDDLLFVGEALRTPMPGARAADSLIAALRVLVTVTT